MPLAASRIANNYLSDRTCDRFTTGTVIVSRKCSERNGDNHKQKGTSLTCNNWNHIIREKNVYHGSETVASLVK